MRFLLGSGRQLASFLCFDFSKPAVLVGVGHWLHDTPPIFSDRIMRIIGVRSFVGNRTIHWYERNGECFVPITIDFRGTSKCRVMPLPEVTTAG
jgi:hypothetical protein